MWEVEHGSSCEQNLLIFFIAIQLIVSYHKGRLLKPLQVVHVKLKICLWSDCVLTP